MDGIAGGHVVVIGAGRCRRLRLPAGVEAWGLVVWRNGIPAVRRSARRLYVSGLGVGRLRGGLRTVSRLRGIVTALRCVAGLRRIALWLLTIDRLLGISGLLRISALLGIHLVGTLGPSLSGLGLETALVAGRLFLLWQGDDLEDEGVHHE